MIGRALRPPPERRNGTGPQQSPADVTRPLRLLRRVTGLPTCPSAVSAPPVSSPRRRLAVTLAWTGALTGVVGAVAALVSDGTEPVFLTDSISYVPSEAWGLHGLVVGATMALLAFALWGGGQLAGWLIRRGLLFTVVGVFLAGMGALMVALALGLAPLDDGQRVMFGGVLGPVFVGMGGWMLAADLRARRRSRG